MKDYDSHYTPDYGEDFSTVASLRKFKYNRNREAYSTIRMLQSRTGCIVDGSILASLVKQGFHLDTALDNKSVYDPDKLWASLAKYVSKEELHYNKSVAKRAWDLTFKAFGAKGETLEPLNDVEAFRSALKQDKSAGAPHFGKKIDSFESDYRRHQRIVEGVTAPPPCVAYHRVQHGIEGPKVRLVWGYPASMTIAESRFARPLIDHYLRSYTCMAFGLHKHHVAARLVPISNSGLRYSLDFSGFDTSIRAEFIGKAFQILKTFFPENEENEKYWSVITRYFIHTPIIMPDGYVYQKHGGVPSGSFFTQMIDSIVNYFAIQYMSLRISEQPVEDRKLLVLGDDSVFGWNKLVSLDQIQDVMSEIGLKINVLKSLVSRENELIEFLGHSWNRGLMDRSPEEIAKRMAFPEVYSKLTDPHLRMATRMLSYSADAVSSWLIIYKWSQYRSFEIATILTQDIDESGLTGLSKHVRDVRGDTSTVYAHKLAVLGLLT